jgi:hypothetical protein
VAVIVIVTDGPNHDIVSLVRREEPAVFPLGAQQFGPTPNGRIFPRAADTAMALNAVLLESISDNINSSPFLTEAQRAEARSVYNSILPGDRLQAVPRTVAEQTGLIARSPVAVDVPPTVQKSIIAQFIDP